MTAAALKKCEEPDDEMLREMERAARKNAQFAILSGGSDWLRDEARERYSEDAELVAKIDAELARREVVNRRKALLGAGALLLDRDIDAIATGRLQETEAVQWARKFVAAGGDRPWLWLVGSMGRGKSVAAALVIALIGAGLWIRAARLERLVFPALGDRDPPDPHGNGCAVLDDIGAQLDSPKFASALAEWHEERLNRWTVVTSNLSAADLKERLDPRLRDRLSALAVVVEVSGDSLRDQSGGLG